MRQPLAAHLASVAPQWNSASSGWATMASATAGTGRSREVAGPVGMSPTGNGDGVGPAASGRGVGAVIASKHRAPDVVARERGPSSGGAGVPVGGHEVVGAVDVPRQSWLTHHPHR